MAEARDPTAHAGSWTPVNAERVLAGPRGRRMLLELVLGPTDDDRADPARGEARAVVFDAAYLLDPGAGVSLVRMSVACDDGEEPDDPPEPEATPADAAAALAAAPLVALDTRHLRAAVTEAVGSARSWQPPDGQDVLSVTPEVATALRTVAEQVAAAPAAAWWGAPMAAAQHAVHLRGEIDPRPWPDDEPAEALRRMRTDLTDSVARAAEHRRRQPGEGLSGCWWSAPVLVPWRSTSADPDGVPWGLDWIEDDLGEESGVSRALTAGPGARVYEIDGPAAWADLCRRFPVEVTAEVWDDWFHTTGRRGRWVIPDWVLVAAEYDAVHLTVLAYLEAAGTAIPVPDPSEADVASVIAGWAPDSTFWLTDAAALSDRPVGWRRGDAAWRRQVVGTGGEDAGWWVPTPGVAPAMTRERAATDDPPRVRLVCLHGIAGSVENWAWMADALPASMQVVALDLPGFGRAERFPAASTGRRRVEGPGTIRYAERLVDGVLDELAAADPVPRTVLVGNSMGGLIASRIATRRHDLAGVVLLDTVLPSARRLPSPWVAGVAGLFLVPGVGRSLQRARRRWSTPERAMRQVLRLATADPSRIGEPMREEHLALVRERWPWTEQDRLYENAARTTVLAAARRRRLDADLDALAARHLPVLMVHGTHDRLVPVGGALRMARLHPEWDVRIEPDLGHLPMMEDPQRVAGAVQEWVSRLA